MRKEFRVWGLRVGKFSLKVYPASAGMSFCDCKSRGDEFQEGIFAKQSGPGSKVVIEAFLYILLVFCHPNEELALELARVSK